MQNVTFGVGDYSTTNTLASFINNKEFIQGFVDYVNGKKNSQSYIWYCLSAVSEDIGETVYANVKNYIDYVSNVETCKIQSLKSMMMQLGFDYTIFDNIEFVPREVIGLLNVVSINKKYLLKKDYIKEAFLQDMKDLSVVTSTDIELSDYYELSAIDNGYTKTTFQISDEKYQEYVEYLFTTLLSGFCTLEYNQKEGQNDDNHYYIYKTISKSDLGLANEELGDFNDVYEKDINDFMLQHNVSPTFQYKEIVDNIENGEGSIDDYSYPESEVLKMEFDRRAAKVSVSELNKSISDSVTLSGVTETQSIKDETRYSYYRKQKVIEYIRFINNKYFIDNTSEFESMRYQLNPSYIELQSLSSNFVLTSDKKLVESVIRSVAKSLAIAAQYICKLRNKIKLQVQKNYMKGTQNLLLYIINEYLIDYSRHKLQMLDLSSYRLTGDQPAQLCSILSALSSHAITDLGVIEYYDTTQYYNLSTESTARAMYANEVNSKFWNAENMTDDGISYRLNQISRFYTDVMMMKNELSGIDELSDFLDTIFDVGADMSYYDKSNNMFSTKLSAHDGMYASEVYEQHQDLSANLDGLNEWLDGRDYTPKSEPISDQISTILDFIKTTQEEEKLSGVSAIYDEYQPQVDAISAELNTLVTNYNNFLSGDMSFYFKKSDCKYCYGYDDDGLKYYKHDWYIDNPAYSNEEGYFLYELQNFRRFLDADGIDEKNVVNWPLIDTIVAVSGECARLCAEYKTEVASAIELSRLSGFYDINALTLDDELQNGYDYLNGRINRRFEFLQKNLEQVRAEANQLRTSLDRIKQNFAQVVSQYDDGDTLISLGIDYIREVSMRQISRDSVIGGSIKMFSFTNFCDVAASFPTYDPIWIQKLPGYDMYAGVSPEMTADAKEHQGYYNGSYPYIEHQLSAYKEDAPLETRIAAFLQYQDTPTTFIPVIKKISETVREASIETEQYGLRKEGSYAAAVQCKQNVEALNDQILSVVKQVNDIGGQLDITAINLIEDKVNAVIEYVSTSFNEGCFENDSLILLMRKLMAKITDLSVQYLPVKADFEMLRNDPTQAIYLNDLTSTQLTFQSLKEHIEYATQKDNENRANLIATEEKYEDDIDTLYAKYTDIANNLQELTYEWQYLKNKQKHIIYPTYQDKSSGILEVALSDVANWLQHDMDTVKTSDAEQEVERIVDDAAEHIEKMSKYISESLALKADFFKVVDEKLHFLDVFSDKQYLEREKLFLTYSGRDFCYYPYFNYQNVTHPSYQIHPFLWNFVAKDTADLDKLAKTFYGYRADSLIGSKFISEKVDELYGEFGQSTKKWLDPDVYDYTGYTTKYESSNHQGIQNGKHSEVIDYEGAFYPPAVDYLKAAYSTEGHASFFRCLASISSAVVFNTAFMHAREEDLSADITNMISVTDNYDDDNNVTSVTYAKDLSVNNILERSFKPYLASCDIQASIDNYFIKNLTESSFDNVSKHNLITSIIADVGETFYSKYYGHLQLEDNSNERAYIVEQLSTYFPSMLSTVLSSHTLSAAYDIYKCGCDANGNTYVLMKQYDDAEPTYYDKKNTVGDIWIRLADHPISFPAFSGKCPNCRIEKESDLPHLVYLLAQSEDPNWPSRKYIKTSMEQFYDFEISKDQKKLFLVSKIATEDGKALSSSNIQHYENPWVSVCQTEYAANVGNRILIDLTYISEDDRKTDYIQSGANSKAMPSLSSDTEDLSVDNYAFLGQYIKNNTTVCFVYAKKHYEKDADGNLNVKLLNDVKIHQVINGVVNGDYEVDGKGIIADPTLDQIAFAFDGKTLTFAYLKENHFDESAALVTKSNVDLKSNTSGSTFRDPRSTEMNSHDVFTTDIAVLKCNVLDRSLVKAKAAGDIGDDIQSVHNMNADMSYLPLYPGLSGEISAYSTSVSSDIENDCLRFQLLGNSKNIDSQIAQVNPDVDPYFDMNRISNDFTYGRVYEDYDFQDMSFRWYQSPIINSSATGTDETSCMMWTISLSNVGYVAKDYNNLKIAIYSKKTLGKNPYLIASLKQIETVSSNWINIPNYNQSYSIENSRETQLSTTADYPGLAFTATGTYNNKKFLNRTDSNYINNISSMQVQFDKDTKDLKLKFNILSTDLSSFTYIGKEELQVILYNQNDLKSFNFFHYLDAYGAINLHEAKELYIDTLAGDGWTFIQTKEKKPEKQIVDDFNAYNDIKRSADQLDIDVSKYNYLSDIYVLKGRKMLSFKYSDDDHFRFDSDNYYFPTLNVKYPKVIGDFVTSPSCQLEKAARTTDLSNTFDDNNLFILDLTDPQISSEFGRVEIEMQHADDESLDGFEEMTEFDGTDFTISSFFNKYDVNDSRSMQQVDFTEFCTDNEAADPTEVRNIVSAAYDKYADSTDFLNAIALSAATFGLSLDPFGQEQSKTKMLDSIAFDISQIDLADLLKLYVNYKKKKNGIVLYFNYYNYINTPYIKIVDGKTYPDYIQSSYCRVAPNEVGYVSIVIQLKYYKDEVLNGYKNVTVATYKVTNVSDDKPKFIIEQISKLKKGDLKVTRESPNVIMTVRDVVIDLADYADEKQLSSKPTFNLYIDIETDRRLSAPYEIGVDYPYDLAQPTEENGTGFFVDYSTNGYFNITVNESNLNTIRLGMQMNEQASELSNYINRYQVLIDKAYAEGQNGEVANIDTIQAAIEVRDSRKQ